jgi:hypothetical protein
MLASLLDSFVVWIRWLSLAWFLRTWMDCLALTWLELNAMNWIASGNTYIMGWIWWDSYPLIGLNWMRLNPLNRMIFLFVVTWLWVVTLFLNFGSHYKNMVMVLGLFWSIVMDVFYGYQYLWMGLIPACSLMGWLWFLTKVGSILRLDSTG